MLYGGVLALALRESGRDGVPVVVGAAVLGGMLGGTIEMAQLIIRSRGTDATSVALAVAGATAGAFVVQAAGRRVAPRRWVGPALLLWGLAVALTNWTPPRFTLDIGPKLRWSLFVPFLNYYRRTDIYALSDLLNQVMAFIPLGLLLAVRDGRRPVWQARWLVSGSGSFWRRGSSSSKPGRRTSPMRSRRRPARRWGSLSGAGARRRGRRRDPRKRDDVSACNSGPDRS